MDCKELFLSKWALRLTKEISILLLLLFVMASEKPKIDYPCNCIEFDATCGKYIACVFISMTINRIPNMSLTPRRRHSALLDE